MVGIIILSFTISVIGCGEFDRQWKCSMEGNNCEEVDRGSGDGKDQEPSTGSTGNEGPRGPAGEPGSEGPGGPAGTAGESGTDGESCTVTQLSNGAIIGCEDGTTAIIYNGTDGSDGEDGEAGEDGEDGSDSEPGVYTITELIDPCGDSPGNFDEVLFRTFDGTLLAHYSDGGNRQFLTVIGPGIYQTTDGTGCQFTVNPDLSVSW